MAELATLRGGRKLGSPLLVALVAFGSLPAHAAIVETATIANSYSYVLGGSYNAPFETGSAATSDPQGGR